MKFVPLNGKLKWVLSSSAVLLMLGAAFGLLKPRQPKLEARLYHIGFGNQPPQHFRGKDGKPTGLAVELINEAALRSRIHLQWSFEPESSEAALRQKKVDLWPVMTIRPERKGIVYITEPYREDAICLLVRSVSRFARLQDFNDATIAYDGEPINVRVLRPDVPNAKLSVIESPKARLEAVCQQRVDAAYFDESTAIAALLDGVSCGEQGLRFVHIPELTGRLGIGATFEARPAADALRKEIGRMAAEGTVARIASRWRSFSSGNLEVANELARAEAAQRWLIAGIAGSILLLIGTLWQAARTRQALASAREATALKNQFLANMSHEIRTPMNAILGMTELAIDTTDRLEQREYLDDVKCAAESLLTLLNDILDFSKIEAGKLTFERVEFDVNEVVRGVYGLFATEAENKGLHLGCRGPETLCQNVRGDPARLRQTLLNLVGNAIKFTETGRVELEAAVEEQSEAIVKIRFTVKDTGIGISDEVQKRIFDSFVQGDGSVTRKYGGTGLGLSISRELISIMGGELYVDSVPGRGSTFWFTLPFEKADKAGATVAAQPTGAECDQRRERVAP
jgi:signal transduction histidine kinase